MADSIRAIREMLPKEFASAAMECSVENLSGREWAILEWRDPKGLRGYGFFQVRNDKIALQRGYWNKVSFSKSHGLPLRLKTNRLNYINCVNCISMAVQPSDAS